MVRGVAQRVVIGVDPHQGVNAVVVVDPHGDVLERGTFSTGSAGMRELAAFAGRFSARTWAVEGCNGVGKHLSQRLVAGERVLDLSTRQSSLVGVFAGGNGHKSDDTDALSIALVGCIRRACRWYARMVGPRRCGCWRAGVPSWSPPAPRPSAGSRGTCSPT